MNQKSSTERTVIICDEDFCSNWSESEPGKDSTLHDDSSREALRHL